jgi:hypothetical protein
MRSRMRGRGFIWGLVSDYVLFVPFDISLVAEDSPEPSSAANPASSNLPIER